MNQSNKKKYRRLCQIKVLLTIWLINQFETKDFQVLIDPSLIFLLIVFANSLNPHLLTKV